jgi:hypothetical protein
MAALIFAYYFYTGMMQEDEGTEIMRDIAQSVRLGAMAYLSAQYRAIIKVFLACSFSFHPLAAGRAKLGCFYRLYYAPVSFLVWPAMLGCAQRPTPRPARPMPPAKV